MTSAVPTRGPAAKVRVLVVDDAVVARRMVSDVLSADSAIEVVGTAANGKIALAKLPQINPDVVTLDVEMPELDGLATLRELRKAYPRLPVIMFSTLTARGASATLDALAAGANDYVTKPANVGSAAAAMARIREELIPKVKLWFSRVGPTELAPTKPAPAGVGSPPAGMFSTIASGAPVPAGAAGRERVEVVVIGVSTGGPNALADIIPVLPKDLPVPVLVVQHMPPVFTRMLAERLDHAAAVAVKEAVHDEPILPGAVYLAPGDQHMTIARGLPRNRVRLGREEPENSCRPAVDPLFRSAAAVYGRSTLALVLTGMGQDGLRGAEAVRRAGGRVLAQDEATSVVWGMPGVVARAGLPERLLPLPEVAPTLARIVSENRLPRRASA